MTILYIVAAIYAVVALGYFAWLCATTEDDWNGKVFWLGSNAVQAAMWPVYLVLAVVVVVLWSKKH